MFSCYIMLVYVVWNRLLLILLKLVSLFMKYDTSCVEILTANNFAMVKSFHKLYVALVTPQYRR